MLCSLSLEEKNIYNKVEYGSKSRHHVANGNGQCPRGSRTTRLSAKQTRDKNLGNPFMAWSFSLVNEFYFIHIIVLFEN